MIHELLKNNVMGKEKLTLRLKKSNEFLAAIVNHGVLDAEATGIINKCILNNTIEIDRANQPEQALNPTDQNKY